MVTKKKQVVESDKTVLVRPREKFKKELEERIASGEAMLNRNFQTMNDLDQFESEFHDWNDYNEELIKQSFNHQSNAVYYNEYARVNQTLGLMDYMSGINTNAPAYKLKMAKDRVDNCVTNLKRLVAKLPLIEESSTIVKYDTAERTFHNTGFIVHGHNDIVKLEVARFVENDLGKRAIILHEQANLGQTIIEKFESNAVVDFAVALWTADDEGRAKSMGGDLKNRARQNVVAETGFFTGTLGRKNVIVLYEDGVEIPSDYLGVVYIPLSGNWKDSLRREIEAIYFS